MSKISFDELYMELAQNLAKKSHCVKMKVGAVISKDTRIISLGYNGPPAGTHNCDEEWPETGCPRDRKGGCSLALHAEANAILYAAKNQMSLDKATLYVTLAPCLACAICYAPRDRLVRGICRQNGSSQGKSAIILGYGC